MRIAVILSFGVLAAGSGTASGKPPINSASSLPPKVFATPVTASRLIQDDRYVTDVVPQLRMEADRVRASYDIVDPDLADTLRAGLAAIAILERRPSDAEALVRESRAAATKPQDRSIGRLPADLAAASITGRGIDCAAGAARLSMLLRASDAGVIRDEVLSRYAQIETASAPFFMGIAAEQLDAAAARRGGITLLEGLRLAGWRMQVAAVAPCRQAYTATMRTWLASPENKPADIWAAREPAPSQLATARSVVVAVWDSGFDTTLFGGQLARDPAEPLDGQDNDGNGVVDDWSGPTFGNRLEPIAAPLAPMSPALERQFAFLMVLSKGGRDLDYGLDTPEAQTYARRTREAGPIEQTLDSALWSEVGYRTHGTAVASVIADGAPFVRLYDVAALPFGRVPEPLPLDEGQIGRWITIIGQLGQRLRGAGVRVVNMSWGITADEIATNLMTVGDEADQARANARARALYARVEASLRTLIADCPDIMFVVGAGNSDQPDEVLQAMPQSISAPNLLAVGATGSNGRPTSFTTYGRNVGLYALGEAVPVRWPGGMSARSSGTSEAAPMVARAAAAMLAVRPELRASDVVHGLIVSATDGQGGIKLLDTANAVRWATAH